MTQSSRAKDVARFVELALFDPGLSRTILSVGGPENLTLNQLVGQIERAAGRKAAVKHVPLPMMRLMSLVMRPLKPDVAAMIQGGIAFDTVDMTFDASDLLPQIELTRIADVVDRQRTATPARISPKPSDG